MLLVVLMFLCMFLKKSFFYKTVKKHVFMSFLQINVLTAMSPAQRLYPWTPLGVPPQTLCVPRIPGSRVLQPPGKQFLPTPLISGVAMETELN